MEPSPWKRRTVEERITALENGSRLIGTTNILMDRLNRFGSTLDEMGDRVRRLESQTEFETTEDDARIKALERRVRAIEEDEPDDRVPELERRMASVEDVVEGHEKFMPRQVEQYEKINRRMVQLERSIETALDRISETNGRVTDETQRINDLRKMHHDLVKAAHDYGVPTSGGVVPIGDVPSGTPPVLDYGAPDRHMAPDHSLFRCRHSECRASAERAKTRLQAMPEWQNGFAQGIDEAARRAEAYWRRAGSATIRGVVDAIRGANPLIQPGRPIKDNPQG